VNIVDEIKTGAFADPSTPVGAIIYAIVFAFFAWLIGRTLSLSVHRVLVRDKDGHVDRTRIKFLSQLARIGVYVFAFISYAHLIPSLAKLGTAWLASVGVLSVIAGLAAQNTLGNVIAGLSLVLYRPFKVGDRLQVSAPTGLESGLVESLNLGYTVLRTDDNRRVVVPNSVMASQTTVNLSGDDPRAVCSIPVGISYDSNIDKARSILLDLARQHPKAQQVSGCPVTKLGPSGVELTLTVWCSDPSTAGDLKNDLLEQIKKKLFASPEVTFPFPQQVVTITSDPKDIPDRRESPPK
jgi:small-conductance mechanosensitive channel